MKKLISLLLLSCLLLNSCTLSSHHLAEIEKKLDERTRENNQAIYLVSLQQRALLQLTQQKLSTAQFTNQTAILAQTNLIDATHALDGATNANEIITSFSHRNEEILGLPLQNQQNIVNDLMSSNANLRAGALQVQEEKHNQEQVWRGTEEKYQQKLIDMGVQAEAERNARIKFWTKWGLIALLVIGGPIALCVLFPPLLGLLASLFPRILSWAGLISHKVLVSTVKGIGETRNVLKIQTETAKVNNTPEPSYTSSEALALVDKHLYENQDDKNQKLIDATREKANV